MSYYLTIISPLSSPLYEAQFQSSKQLPQSSNSSTHNTPTPGPSSSTGLSSFSAGTSSSFPSWSSFTGVTPNTGSGSGSGSGGTPIAGGGGGGGGRGVGKDPFPASLLGGNGSRPTERHVLQMIAHSSLDVVEEVMISTGSQYLKNIDRFNEWTVSAFVAPCVKIILLHSSPNDEGIRGFFMDVWESYVKVSLNPFHTPSTPIQSPLFENKIRASARKNL